LILQARGAELDEQQVHLPLRKASHAALNGWSKGKNELQCERADCESAPNGCAGFLPPQFQNTTAEKTTEPRIGITPEIAAALTRALFGGLLFQEKRMCLVVEFFRRERQWRFVRSVPPGWVHCAGDKLALGRKCVCRARSVPRASHQVFTYGGGSELRVDG
jgi:hypothetical protein